MRIQCQNQCRSFLNDANPRVTMTVNSPLVALGQAKPTLQVQIVTNLFKLGTTHEKPGEKADHHPSHVLVN